MTDVIVVGDVMVDVSVDAGRLVPGGDVHGRVCLGPGGVGTNAAAWAAHEGAAVSLYGRVGDDLAGALLVEALGRRGVEARLAVDPEARTGTMLVVRHDGDRSMVADRGANARLSPDDLPGRLEARCVLVSGYLLFDPGSEPAARVALERADAEVVAVDAASWPLLDAYGPERFLEATAPATLLLANHREIEVLGDPAHLPYAAVCVKRGEQGAEALWSGLSYRCTVEPQSAPVDPTGAGDAFDGALLAALARGEEVPRALAAACRVGRSCAGRETTWPP